MFLFTILAITLLSLAVFTIFAISVVGSVGIVIFADVIVCVLIIAWIIKYLAKKKQQ